MSGRLPGKISTPKVGNDGTKRQKEVNRGTQDELEILGLIIVANVGLRTIVMDRLRQAKARCKTRDDVRKARGETDDAKVG
jgi:hypothetical protein